MTELVKIPLFPLSIFPLPGEMVPLHIFEPRYKQLLHDAETKDTSFGIYFNHVSNVEKLGSLVKLESVIKRYENGESDIIVKCTDMFSLNMMYRTFRDKMYPGGEVSLWNEDVSTLADEKLAYFFKEYLSHFLIRINEVAPTMYSIANELALDFEERLRFVKYDTVQKERFLLSQLRYQTEILLQAERSKDLFHLN